MDHYYRIAPDTRGLNYDKFYVEGTVHTEGDEAYTSHNTNRLDVDGVVKKKIMGKDYVKGEIAPGTLMPVVGENLGVTCGNILGRSYKLLSELKPDVYLVFGDTNSCLSAISAKCLHIPLFHMEAGNRCKDECLPE